MILEGLDGFFSHIASVFLGGNFFIGYAGGLNGCLVLRCCLIVEDLMFGDEPCIASVLKHGHVQGLAPHPISFALPPTKKSCCQHGP
jgi:hypothetical protein